MFSVRFRHRVRRRRRPNDFCFSRQNRLSFTLDIWDKESIGLSGKMYWMTFRWPWLKVTAVTLINKNLPNFLRKFRMCFFKVKHSMGHISGMVGPIDVKRKGCALVGYWVNYVTLTFHLTYDLDLVVSRSKFEIALYEDEREWKGCESIIHDHDCDLWVTMVGWVDVPYSDWGDFRRRRAVDISSLFQKEFH